MSNNNRPDLSNRSIIILLFTSIILAIIILLFPIPSKPGSSFGQTSATIGTVFLLAPALFLIMKRSGFSASPPTWFVAHVLSTLIGSSFIFTHVRSADWLTPPGFILLLLVFLLFQGSLLRVLISRGLSLLFARNTTQHGFGVWHSQNKESIQAIINQKNELLKSLNKNAQEALFSPELMHWLKHPILSTRYQRLAEKEASLVGARQAAGKTLAWSRRIHMTAGALFYVGLITHLIVVLFFAGYAAGGEEISWWYITDWGR